MGFIIHIQPDSIENEKKSFLGSTKDIIGRTEYFSLRGFTVKPFLCRGRSDDEALRMLVNADLDGCDAVVFEYETYLNSLAYLKDNYPKILRIVRAHNSNLPHFVDQYRGRLRMLQDKPVFDGGEPIEDIATALDRFRMDCQCAELSNYIMPICAWEAEHYWGQLTSPEKVVNVPYYVPSHYASQIPRIRKHNLFVCFMGTGGIMTPLLYDAGKNTVALVNALPKKVAKDWMFCITGRINPSDILGKLGRLIPTGRLPSPLPILAESRVVSILSDLGMGFKTKILEAIQAGCWVLVSTDLFSRLPDPVRPWCISVDLKSSDDLARALTKCADPAPEGDPNRQLRLEAFAGMDRVFGGGINMVQVEPLIHSEMKELPTSLEDFSSAIPSYFAPLFNKGKSVWLDYLQSEISNISLGVAVPRVLDYGVGMGRVLRAASHMGFECGGVDSSSAMLDYCRLYVPNVSRLGNIGEDGICDFPSEWADFIYSCEALSHLSTMSQFHTAIREISRMLKPGGCLKFLIRSTARQSPKMSWLNKEVLLNMESKTIFFRIDKLSRLHDCLGNIPFPRIGSYEHSAWDGVPLSMGRVKSLLRSVALNLQRIEQEDGSQKNFWITARKQN